MNHHRGTTLLEVLAAITAVIFIVALALPALAGLARGRRMMPNSAQLKGIHQAMNMYAQGNGSHFPGLDPRGRNIDTSPEYRYQVLLEADYFVGDYIISPGEHAVAWKSGPVTYQNYSYAMLRITDEVDDKFRRQEWKDTVNSQAAIMSDRNTGLGKNYQSIWTDPAAGPDWRGAVIWNDNHVAIETRHEMENTQYGEAVALEDDSLFETGDGVDIHGNPSDAANGAMMTFSSGELILPGRTAAPNQPPAPSSATMVVLAMCFGSAFGAVVTGLARRRRQPEPIAECA